MAEGTDLADDDWRRACYNRIAQDLNRYRDYRWKIPIWTATFLAALAAACQRIPPCWFMGALATGGAVLVCVFSTWNLHLCYEAYAKYRKSLDDIEDEHGLTPGAESPVQKESERCGLRGFIALGCRPNWDRRIRWEHKFFRVAWFALIIGALAFALGAIWMRPTNEELDAKSAVSTDGAPVLEKQSLRSDR